VRLIAKPKDALAGAMFVLIGATFVYVGQGLRLGTAQQMGPGYFPLILASILVLFGLVLLVRSFFGEREEMETFPARTSLPILAGAFCFALLLFNAGLALAVIATVLVGSIAARDLNSMQALLIAVVLAISSVVIFVLLLGQPIPIIGAWFGS
jgi:hypothetical protein